MVVQTRVAHAQEVLIIGLPFDGVFGQGLLVIFHRQRFLKHIDMHFFSGQIMRPQVRGESLIPICSRAALTRYSPNSGLICIFLTSCIARKVVLVVGW